MSDLLKTIKTNPLHEDIKAYAVACRLSREEKISSGELRVFAEELMNAISASCIHQGAEVLGHIKAYFDYGTGFLHVHTLGEPGDVTVDGRDGDPASHFKLVINSVVYGLSEEAVKEATESVLTNLISEFRFQREP
jgi:hypothetical protein